MKREELRERIENAFRQGHCSYSGDAADAVINNVPAIAALCAETPEEKVVALRKLVADYYDQRCWRQAAADIVAGKRDSSTTVKCSLEVIDLLAPLLHQPATVPGKVPKPWDENHPRWKLLRGPEPAILRLRRFDGPDKIGVAFCKDGVESITTGGIWPFYDNVEVITNAQAREILATAKLLAMTRGSTRSQKSCSKRLSK
jgi:hypothetical protein